MLVGVKYRDRRDGSTRRVSDRVVVAVRSLSSLLRARSLARSLRFGRARRDRVDTPGAIKPTGSDNREIGVATRRQILTAPAGSRAGSVKQIKVGNDRVALCTSTFVEGGIVERAVPVPKLAVGGISRVDATQENTRVLLAKFLGNCPGIARTRSLPPRILHAIYATAMKTRLSRRRSSNVDVPLNLGERGQRWIEIGRVDVA